MKTLVVYDSVFGNTEQVARSIASAIAGTVKLTKISAASVRDLDGVDLLVLGSPTLGGRATKPMQEFVESIPRAAAEKVRCAAFDTRLTMKFAKIFGYAAPRMADELAHKGGAPASDPEGFIVKGRNGPLAEGELQRASAWGSALGAKKGGA